MAYQSVGQCRFFVDHLLWLKTLDLEYYGGYSGVLSARESFIGLNPTQSNIVNVQSFIPLSGSGVYIDYVAAPPIMTSDNKWKAYVALLGHNSASAQAAIKYIPDNEAYHSPNYRINFDPDTSSPYDGFTLGYDFNITATTIRFGFDPVNVTDGYDTDFHIGCISHGNYFDMPHSPDLNLTMTREYGGIKTIETKGGASLSNSFYTKPPKWGELEAWQIGNEDFSVGGRRIWSLSFSFLSDSSVFPDNPTEIANAGGWEVDDTTPDFMSEVLKKTRGSMLPFIFQPNTDENIFAIAKFDQQSFSFQQTAPNLYSVKMKIREVW